MAKTKRRPARQPTSSRGKAPSSPNVMIAPTSDPRAQESANEIPQLGGTTVGVASRPPDAQAPKKSWLDIATFVVVSFYAAITFWQGCLTQKIVKTEQATYEASERPYVGVSNVTVVLMGPSADGTLHQTSPQSATQLQFAIVAKNFGNVPAENFQSKIDMRRNGNPVEGWTLPSRPAQFFPSEPYAIANVTIPKDSYIEILSGAIILQADVYLSYERGDKRYEYCERLQYEPNNARFVNLGAKCGERWAEHSMPDTTSTNASN